MFFLFCLTIKMLKNVKETNARGTNGKKIREQTDFKILETPVVLINQVKLFPLPYKKGGKLDVMESIIIREAK